MEKFEAALRAVEGAFDVVYLLNHARAEKAAEGQNDLARVLTEAGRLEAAARSRDPPLSRLPLLRVTSQASRAKQTLGITTLGMMTYPETLEIVELYPCDQGEMFDELFRRHKHAPLATYFEVQGAREELQKLARRAINGVWRAIAPLRLPRLEEHTLVIAGHDLVNRAIALELAEARVLDTQMLIESEIGVGHAMAVARDRVEWYR